MSLGTIVESSYMPKCVWCGAETQLHSGGEPICLACDNARESTTPMRDRSSPTNEAKREAGCDDRDRLLDLMLVALKAYNDALQAIPQCKGEAVKRARQLAANAEATYKDCREVLMAHERSHGCAPPPFGREKTLTTHP